jgi:APA family basic amino acid/polyamine antiporter
VLYTSSTDILSVEMSQKKPVVFLREATGLVRDFGMWDAFVFATGAIVGPAWIPIFASMWFFFPGVNITAAELICALLAVGHGLYYVYICTAMPRSGGGSYVPLSRIIHPALGMGMSSLFVLCMILDMGYVGSFTFTSAIAGPLGVYGIVTGNQSIQNMGTLLATPTWTFVAGTILIVLVGLVAVSGNKYIKTANTITFIIGTVGFLFLFAIIVATTQSQFRSTLDNFAGAGTYQNIITTAHQSGWNLNVDWVMPTLLSVPLAYFSLQGYAFNAYFTGEIKRVSRSMTAAVIGSIVFSAGIFAITASASENAFGKDFVTSAGYLFLATPSSYPLSVPPYLSSFIALMNTNLIVNLIILASYLCWAYLLIINYYFLASRHFLAWAFDRTIPSAFGEVSDRLHSPVRALLITGFLGWIALLFYTFLGPIMGSVNVLFFFLAAEILDGVAGGVLPWRLKDFFASTPAFVRRKIGGLPVITILGAYAVLFIASLFVISLLNPATVGPFGIPTAVPTVLVFLLGVGSYFAMKAYFANRGLDISMAFKSIPPE